MGDVLRMVDHAPVGVGSHEELIRWAKTWLKGLEDGDFGQMRSMVITVETQHGQVATIAQSLMTTDRTRLVGLMELAKAQVVEGEADIEDLYQGDDNA